MNLSGFLKQEIAVQRKTGSNDYGEATYSASTTLPARIEEKQSLVRNQQGAEMLATTRVMTVEELAVGDLVNGLEIAARENIVDVQGRVLGWTLFL